MNDAEPSPPPFYARRMYRALTAALGLLLLGLGMSVLFLAEDAGWLAQAVAVGLVLLGGNALLAAQRARPSWLSRIGPLP